MGTLGAMGVAAAILLGVVVLISAITFVAVRRGEQELEGKHKK
jgi:hypothetical protein